MSSFDVLFFAGIFSILNTLFALYFLHKNSDYKKSIEELFND